MMLSELKNIDKKIKIIIDNYLSDSISNIDFNSVALEIHKFQYKYNYYYSDYCQKNSINRNLSNINDIPFFSIESFKGQQIPSTVQINENEGVLFETSGTTKGVKGYIYRDKLFFELIQKTVYSIGSKVWFRDFNIKPDLVFLDKPNKRDLPNYPNEYSVLYNINKFFGSDNSMYYDIANANQFCDLIKKLQSNKLLVIISPSYYLSNLLSYIKNNNIQISIDLNSIILESGGLKNKSSHVDYEDYKRDLFNVFKISNSNYFNTYALTEIGSQFTNLKGNAYKEIPPWTKVRILKKVNNKFVECMNNEVGTIVVYDLLNRGSLFGLQTSDTGMYFKNGFILGKRELIN